ncbi:MAG: NAD(P)/FAD-dependent oxidoreductase [Oscillospiraceae bacterium]|nr:NAD(P)/FAD-dependent oxidoreductase [Oscillospiraceae bacterium]
MNNKQVVVIGCGPAGLTAGYELLQAGGYEVTLLEESSSLGGISRTVNANGSRMDIGGHRFFSKDKRVTDWWARLMPGQGAPARDDILLKRQVQIDPNGADPEENDLVMLTRRRISRIYYKNTFFDYPVSLSLNTIKGMGIFTTMRAGLSYLSAAVKKLPEDNLESFYINRFGRVLYSMFFEGYTEKLWGRHPREISAEWGAQRVKGLSVSAVLKDVLGKIFGVKNRKVETSLIEQFSYPKLGPGQLWERAAEKITDFGGVIYTGKKVTRIERDENGFAVKVICQDGSEFTCEILISSMPIKDLTEALTDPPRDISRISGDLPYRDFQTVGLLLPSDKFLLRNGTKAPSAGGIAPDCWIYVQDSSVALGRIQIFNNWSPYLVKDFENTVWIGLEYFCREGDGSWGMPDDEYISFAVSELVKIGAIANGKDVLFSHRERVKKAYPAYFGSYPEFYRVREFLDTIPNLYCVGRNGQHRYNNMDHSMATSFEAVNCIKTGNTDKSAIWNVNTEEDYHESKN